MFRPGCRFKSGHFTSPSAHSDLRRVTAQHTQPPMSRNQNTAENRKLNPTHSLVSLKLCKKALSHHLASSPTPQAQSSSWYPSMGQVLTIIKMFGTTMYSSSVPLDKSGWKKRFRYSRKETVSLSWNVMLLLYLSSLQRDGRDHGNLSLCSAPATPSEEQRTKDQTAARSHGTAEDAASSETGGINLTAQPGLGFGRRRRQRGTPNRWAPQQSASISSQLTRGGYNAPQQHKAGACYSSRGSCSSTHQQKQSPLLWSLCFMAHVREGH